MKFHPQGTVNKGNATKAISLINSETNQRRKGIGKWRKECSFDGCGGTALFPRYFIKRDIWGCGIFIYRKQVPRERLKMHKTGRYYCISVNITLENRALYGCCRNFQFYDQLEFFEHFYLCQNYCRFWAILYFLDGNAPVL